MGVRPRVSKHIIMLGALAALAACSNNDDTFTNVVVPVRVATSLSVNASTNLQSAGVGQALPLPISVRVLDQNGAALAGAIVSWSVVTGGGVLSAATSTTDASGDASVSWVLGGSAGQQTAEAKLANGQTAQFIATANAGAFVGLAIVSGDNQIVNAGFVTAPMVVRAVDAFGNGVAGVAISWTTSDGGVLSAISSTTDKSGEAEVTLTTAGAATYVVTATAGLIFVNFNGTGN